MKNYSSRNIKGFTLIELLVVIAIIGLLSSVIIAPIQSSRKKARDAKRVSDISELKKALEIYFDENNNYPVVCGAASSGAYASNWASVLSTAYIPRMPIDPTNTDTLYGYYYCSGYKPSGACGYVYTALNTDYILATRLENNTSNAAACQSSFGGWDNSYLNYIVGNG